MPPYRKKDLETALSLLDVKLEDLNGQEALRNIEQAAMKKWHPDKAIGAGLNDREVRRYTRIFQKIPACISVFRRYVVESTSGETILSGPVKVSVSDGESITPISQPGYDHYKRVNSSLQYLVHGTDITRKSALIKYLRKLTEDSYDAKEKLKACLNDQSESLMYRAIQDDHTEAVQFFLSFGVAPNAYLVPALEKGNLMMVEALLKAGADPNKRNWYYSRWSLLMDRIPSDTTEAIQLLIKYGADVNSVNGIPGWTPLLEAVECERVDIARALLKAGADVSFKNRNGLTALQLAKRLKNKALLDLLTR